MLFVSMNVTWFSADNVKDNPKSNAFIDHHTCFKKPNLKKMSIVTQRTKKSEQDKKSYGPLNEHDWIHHELLSSLLNQELLSVKVWILKNGNRITKCVEGECALTEKLLWRMAKHLGCSMKFNQLWFNDIFAEDESRFCNKRRTNHYQYNKIASCHLAT